MYSSALTLLFLRLCPLDCMCDESNLFVRCGSSSNLEVVPISLNPDILELNISSTPIQRLDAAFQFYGELRVLDLSFNRITTLEDRCFENQVRLVRLNLAFNALSSFESPKVFFPLPDLEYLSLEGNRIVNISLGVLGHLSKLRNLNLRGNQLSFIPQSTFDGISKTLKEVDLSFNHIRVMDLRGLTGLGSLDLSFNPLESLKGLPHNLRELSLASTMNISSSVFNAMLSTQRDLRFLDLSSNLLQDGLLPPLVSDSLFKLVLHNNSNLQLLNIHASLSQMIRLRSLEVREQPSLRVASMDLSFFERLRYLDISNNPLLESILFSSSGKGSFQLRGRLREVRLANNHLSRFFPGHLREMDSLDAISLSGNPLGCDCHLRWIQDFLRRKRRISFGIFPQYQWRILCAGILEHRFGARNNSKKKIVDANTVAPLSEDTMVGTWRSKSTGMTFLDQNEFIYATPNNGDRIIPALQEHSPTEHYYQHYTYGAGTLPIGTSFNKDTLILRRTKFSTSPKFLTKTSIVDFYIL
ncbi:Leucine-rich repeat-containing protein 24 [Caligus rogercresseyi]|uniref:Leucine-rich repeat-containing protein 24 n=1 Tax=Caligus rogercresseyi TaxID=217165 RepID=A0A7T8QT00_CALRO|nr:Leucine-rich repeat-containing protein 24 [Caligus rogercresseyi]